MYVPTCALTPVGSFACTRLFQTPTPQNIPGNLHLNSIDKRLNDLEYLNILYRYRSDIPLNLINADQAEIIINQKQ